MPPKIILPSFFGCICGKSECQIPFGKCHCGCGEQAAISKGVNASKGVFRGRPRKFKIGHRDWGKPLIEDAMPFKIDGVYCRLIPLTRVYFNNTAYHVGYFPTKEVARDAQVERAKTIQGEFFPKR